MMGVIKSESSPLIFFFRFIEATLSKQVDFTLG